MVKHKDIFFVRASEDLGITKKSAIFDHILLDGHEASFGNFSVLFKKVIHLN